MGESIIIRERQCEKLVNEMSTKLKESLEAEAASKTWFEEKKAWVHQREEEQMKLQAEIEATKKELESRDEQLDTKSRELRIREQNIELETSSLVNKSMLESKRIQE